MTAAFERNIFIRIAFGTMHVVLRGMIMLCWLEIGNISMNDLFPPLCLPAHTPDNSFMGFVAEELNETERLAIQRNKLNNMAVVYGKEASMWKVSLYFKSVPLKNISDELAM